LKSSPEESSGTGLRPVLLIVLAAVTAAYLAAVAFAPPWLIGTPEYHWPVLHHGSWAMLPAAALVLGLAAGASLFLVSGLDGILRARLGRARVYAALMLRGWLFSSGRSRRTGWG
jgi:hypothetical protein